jgi:hypothetical protein
LTRFGTPAARVAQIGLPGHSLFTHDILMKAGRICIL